MTRKDLPARAANIQRAVASPTTCTAATAESLRAYLMPPERPVQQHKKPSNARLPKVKGTPAPAAKKGGAGSRKPPTVTILEISGENENCVQPQDRFTFATEIINAILKSLTEAIKDPPTRKHPQAKRLPLARSSSSSPYPNGVESRSQTPLQPISVNRLASTPSKQCQNRRSSSTTSIKQTWDGLRAQAECARIGFATLRSLQDQKSLVLNLPFLQLETGMSALIGKMLSLGFEDLALRELRILKKRIDGAENATPGQNATRSISFRPGNEKSDSKTETLADLLMFRNTGVQGKMLALIISSQLQVLKLLALTGEASATEVVLQHLRLHVPYSPAILIQRQIESDVGGSPDKAAHQLEVLTQSLIALCPSASSKEDCRMAKSGPHSSAEVVFQIQVLAFQIRSTWWKIAGHRSDIAKDILEPFSRCLGAFHRRSSLERKERYDMAKRNFQIILGSVQNLDGFREEGLFSIYQSLTDLARENSQYLEAIEWSRKARRNAREGELSRTQLCSLKCRIASLEIQSLDLEPSDGVLDSVKDAAQGLEGDLQGGATELDELLIAVASLRRSAFSVFQNSHRSSKGNIKQQYSPLLVDECRNVVLLCVRFLVRYVGSESSKGESDNMTMRRDQRRRQASRVATTFIESFVAVARLSAQSDPDEWGKLEAGLQDCLIVASNLETVSSNENQISGEDEPTSSVFVSISIAYWVRYLHLKRETTDTKCLEKCLRMSIDPIKERSLSEKLAASLPMKLEKYGQLCDLMREHKKGVESYRQALDTHLGSGLLRVAVEAASTTSIQGVFHDDDELGPFFRILQAYPRIAMKAVKNSHSDNPFFDAEGLCNSERGLLLERQLISVLSFLNDRDPYPTSCEVLDKLATLLLSIYTNHEFPVRRLRVIVRLLYLLLTKHNALGDNLRHQVLQEPTIRPASDHYDTGLLGFLSHLTASRGVLVSLYERRPNLKDMELVVRSWSRLVQECPSLDMLQTHVYDIGDWLIQLELLAEYLNMQGLDLLRASVLHLSVAVHEAALSTQCSILISKLSALGLQYARLGYSSLAGVTLQKAQRYLEIYKVPIRITLRWHLSYAEYALLNGNLKCCKENLDKARELSAADISGETAEKMRSRDSSDLAQLTADAYYVHSLLSAAEGQLSKALFCARLCVRNCQRSWAILARSQDRKGETGRNRIIQSEQDALVGNMSELSISEQTSTGERSRTHSILCSITFWALVPRLFLGLKHLSLLYSHHGLFPEVQYYLQQSQQIAEAVDAPSLHHQSLALLGQHLIRGGNVSEGMVIIQHAEEKLAEDLRDRHYALLQLFLATYYIHSGKPQAGESAFVVAEKIIENLLTKSFVIYKQEGVGFLDTAMRELNLKDSKQIRQVSNRKRPPVIEEPLNKSADRRDASKVLIQELTAVEAPALHRLKDESIRGRIYATMCAGNFEVAASQLSEMVAHPRDHQDIVLGALLASRIHFRQGLERLVCDPVFAVIPESTISCPSIKPPSDRQGRMNRNSSPPTGRDTKSARTPSGKGLAKKPRPRDSSVAKAQPDFLRLARTDISSVFNVAKAFSPTAIVHEMSDLLVKILVMLSAVPSPMPKTPVSATALLYSLELSRMLSMRRESWAIQVERDLPHGKGAPVWPEEDGAEGQANCQMEENLELVTFQAEYLDIIPRNWNVVSLTLSQSREEILISKIRSGQTPFVLRLPLDRHVSLDRDEEEGFGYDQGKAELQDIIGLANASTNSAQELSHKGAKTEWWEKRHALDARLHDLLRNIETVWLGGFKGIFSHLVQSSALLSRFHQSLQNILDKHLPSRQKSGRGKQSSRVSLDLRVLELFVGLGNPDDSYNVDESMMDLLYFVVDILQFNGERNAYDEIDFDSMVIEFNDALLQYHQALGKEFNEESEQHTILILDKNLHCFPWESLPCLEGHAVSRLPSLGCLRERLMQQKGDLEPIKERIHVNRNNGASVLNPGSDLGATQARFEEPLEKLTSWETIVQREPTEAEMKACLEDHDIFLYFGHGSGGQYIRSRTIKRLEKCAVALLMGCSSGALTGAGEFEPYGTPMNYMHAGCPAVLATLWDVTDRDIDRFSQTVLEKWGLFGKPLSPASSSPVKRGAKQRSKSRVRETNKVESGQAWEVSLDEAVAQGRDSCILRYLNGAAPVVYGVPVYLSV